MKYSLRSLMTFSIRELLLIMAIIGFALAWYVERDRSAEWRSRTGTLERLVTSMGVSVEWLPNEVTVKGRGNSWNAKRFEPGSQVPEFSAADPP